MVPSFLKAGASLLSDSAVVSGRIPSSRSILVAGPRLELSSTATTSSAITPVSHARCARSWDRAAHASCSSRPISSSRLTSSELSPMCCFKNVDHSPSWTIESIISALPMGAPKRAFGTRYGASDIDSIPPATTTSTSPARMSWSARAMALRPERHTLLMVRAGTPGGDPGLDGRLSRCDLAGARLEHLAHDHVIDVLARYAGAIEGGADGMSPQTNGGHILERSAKLADGGARARYDHRGHSRSLGR